MKKIKWIMFLGLVSNVFGLEICNQVPTKLGKNYQVCCESVAFTEDNTVKDYQVKNLDKQVKTGILN